MTPTIIANAMCDDRVKSPLDPTDPLLGTSGIMSYKNYGYRHPRKSLSERIGYD